MTTDITPHLQMPASFDRARRISVVIVLLFDIVFWLACAFVVAGSLALLFVLPNLAAISAELAGTAATEWAKYSSLPLAGISIGRRLLLTADFMVAMAPGLFILFHGRKLFAGFARGVVFTEASIAHLKALGFWLIGSAVLGVVVQLLFFAIAQIRHPDFDMHLVSFLYGAMTYVAAYVMDEARRIAADNAEIV